MSSPARVSTSTRMKIVRVVSVMGVNLLYPVIRATQRDVYSPLEKPWARSPLPGTLLRADLRHGGPSPSPRSKGSRIRAASGGGGQAAESSSGLLHGTLALPRQIELALGLGLQRTDVVNILG